jgi:hypothetical protein
MLANPAYTIVRVPPDAVGPPGRPACILVVDDDPSMQETVSGSPRQNGIELAIQPSPIGVTRAVRQAMPSSRYHDRASAPDDLTAMVGVVVGPDATRVVYVIPT